MTIERVAATADGDLDSTSIVLLPGLTLTPANGDYFLFATVQFTTDATSGSDFTLFSVYVGGSQIAHSVRQHHEDSSVDNASFTYALSCKVSPNGSEAVEIRYQTGSASSPLVAQNRE